MKNYCKTLSLLFCFTLVAVSSQAQVKYGIKVGANASSLSGFENFYNSLVEKEGDKITTNMTIGYLGGLSLDLSAGGLFFRPELEFSKQGFGAKLKSGGDSDSTTYNLYYLKLPVHIGYKYALNLDTDLRFGIGGYASYLLAGDKSLDVLKLKNLDYGLSVMVACDYVQMSYSLSYEYGLADLIGIDGWSAYKKDNKLSAIRNSCIKLSVAYYF